ncbi:MAG: serine hydrolase [Bacteroidetes bacterium]|nr:serine hydrolase [Bacteroidota bacterium]MDA1242945.1 serine hydrolase [Bacteroidota bacterium]
MKRWTFMKRPMFMERSSGRTVGMLCAAAMAFAGLRAVAQENSFEAWGQTHGLMGYSVAVALEDGATQTYVGGWRDWERQLPMEPSTVFRVASISKAVTATGFFTLWSQGMIGLDDDINDLLNLDHPIIHPNHPNIPITPRMLLSHTSGLRDGSGYNAWLQATYNSPNGAALPSVDDLLSEGQTMYTSDMWGAQSPGSYFVYANINFGLLATVMEAVTGDRFDLWMKDQTFTPLNVNASFNVLDLDDINQVAVLYRNIGGWTPQADQYEGQTPPAPNLDGYIPGTNGARFAPQGGLRASAADLITLAKQWTLLGNGSTTSTLFPAPVVEQFREAQWSFNGSNGSNYGGLFDMWSCGLHLDEWPAESLPFSESPGAMWGHPGEAYGLISGAYHVATDEGCRFHFSYLINGLENGTTLGSDGWYTVENDLHQLVAQWAATACTTAEATPLEGPSRPMVFHGHPGQPLPDYLASCGAGWVDLTGRNVHEPTPWIPSLPSGRYLLTTPQGVVAEVMVSH